MTGDLVARLYPLPDARWMLAVPNLSSKPIAEHFVTWSWSTKITGLDGSFALEYMGRLREVN